MIKGARYWNDPNTYYSQENNPTEQFLVKIRTNGWLYSCGPTAAVTCLAALGYSLKIECPGEYYPQPEEVLMDYFNDPKNFEKLKQIRDLDYSVIPMNEVPQLYPTAVMDVFCAHGQFDWIGTFAAIAGIVEEGKAVQICFESPGHYVAVVAYDEETDELIYDDPWPSRFPDRNGFNRRLSRAEHTDNVKPYAITYKL